MGSSIQSLTNPKRPTPSARPQIKRSAQTRTSRLRWTPTGKLVRIYPPLPYQPGRRVGGRALCCFWRRSSSSSSFLRGRAVVSEESAHALRCTAAGTCSGGIAGSVVTTHWSWKMPGVTALKLKTKSRSSPAAHATHAPLQILKTPGRFGVGLIHNRSSVVVQTQVDAASANDPQKAVLASRSFSMNERVYRFANHRH